MATGAIYDSERSSPPKGSCSPCRRHVYWLASFVVWNIWFQYHLGFYWQWMSIQNLPSMPSSLLGQVVSKPQCRCSRQHTSYGSSWVWLPLCWRSSYNRCKCYEAPGRQISDSRFFMDHRLGANAHICSGWFQLHRSKSEQATGNRSSCSFDEIRHGARWWYSRSMPAPPQALSWL